MILLIVAIVFLGMIGPLPILMGLASAARDRREFTRLDR